MEAVVALCFVSLNFGHHLRGWRGQHRHVPLHVLGIVVSRMHRRILVAEPLRLLFPMWLGGRGRWLRRLLGRKVLHEFGPVREQLEPGKCQLPSYALVHLGRCHRA